MGQYETDTEIVLNSIKILFLVYMLHKHIPCIHFCLDIVCVCVCVCVWTLEFLCILCVRSLSSYD